MTPQGRAKTRRVSASDASAYLSKAKEFLQAAEHSQMLANRVAASSNAVHAGIAAADAISAARTGEVWAGDHGLAARHLEAVGAEGRQGATQLRALIPLKTKAEYDPTPVSAADAAKALKAAERLVALAEQVVSTVTPRRPR